MSTDKRWFGWVIKRNRFENVVSFLKKHVPEVDQYFYPQIKKEYQTKRGVKTKDRPLYEGYLFLHYDNAEVVFHKLRAYPFITTYAGMVSEEDIQRMQDAQGKLIHELRTSRYLPGDKVVLLSGPFKGFDALVLGSERDLVRVVVEATILGQRQIKLDFPEDQLERKPELQDAEVQKIRE